MAEQPSESGANQRQPLSNSDAQLAMELVANIRDRKTVAAAYGLTVAQLRKKFKDPMFKRILRECNTLWNSDANVKERVRTKAGFLIEDSLLDMFAILKNTEVGPRDKNDTFKSLARIAAVDSPEKEAPQSEGFRVVINMGPPPEREIPVTNTLVIDGEAQ